MKPFQNPAQFAFTNHFNQSFLHSRISMMNKTRSTWKTVGKYALFMVAMVGVVAAVKPNQKQPTAGTKYLLRTEDAIEWVITPKTTMADLVKIQEEIRKAGAVFEVNEFKLDPLKSFIYKIDVHFSADSFACGFSGYDFVHPIRANFGKLDLRTKRNCLIFRDCKPSSALLKIAEEDSVASQKVYLANAMQYEIEKLYEEYGYTSFGDQAQYLSVRSFPKPMPDFYVISTTQSLVLRDNVSPEEILKTATSLRKKTAVYRYNGAPVNYEFIAKSNINDLKELFTINVYDRRNKYAQKTFVLIHTLSKYP